MNSSSYSSTPLAKKLGIKNDSNILIINEPSDYLAFFYEFPANVQLNYEVSANIKYDLIHGFFMDMKSLEEVCFKFKNWMKKDASLWVSWPKKSSGIRTDIDRDSIRKLILETGLVDSKVASINETWGGLKFGYRIKDR